MVSRSFNSSGETPNTSTYQYGFAPEYAYTSTRATRVSGYPYVPHNATVQEREACNDRIRAIRARNSNYQPSYLETPNTKAFRTHPEAKTSGIGTPAGQLTAEEPLPESYSSSEDGWESNGPQTPYNAESFLWKDPLGGAAELEPADHPCVEGKKIYFGSYKYYPPAPPPIPGQEHMEEPSSNAPTTTASRSARKELGQVVYEFHTLALGFRFPSNLEFTTPSGVGELPKLAHTPASKPLLEHNHKLEKLLERLDSIQSNGDKEIQRMRKQAVERMLLELDGLKRMESMALYNFNYERGINA
ncbi:unnamed protein product [Rhizoctonia solani]|uniref:BAG domain-containing protein n=1 Tax=Rhizoctonia solani TaxID=456999 RepID=A0A8H3A581_9AGAM|nr:unnamed protein product [Rhizoctonia solani]